MKTLHSSLIGNRPAISALARRFSLPLLFLGAGLMVVQPCAGAPFQFEPTGSLATAREHHTATLLPNGKVLVAGGSENAGALASAELYDPATGTWMTTGSLNDQRTSYTATLLPNGKVLVVGGYGRGIFGVWASAELYDPVSGTWTATGSLATRRWLHTATLLPDGKVLVAAGAENNNPIQSLASAEVYDPASETWATTGSLAHARSEHTATLLPNGKVVVAAGSPT